MRAAIDGAIAGSDMAPTVGSFALGDRVRRPSTDDAGVVVHVDGDGAPTVQWDRTVCDPDELELVEPARPCAVCGTRDRMRSMLGYMVHDDVWSDAGLEPRDVAHAECLEERLGRRLRRMDLTDASINEIARALLRPPRVSGARDE